MYELYYVEKVRSVFQSTSLLFGSAMDGALNRLLLECKQYPTQEDLDIIIRKSAEDIFLELWNPVLNMEYVVYTKKDYDESLLEKEDIDQVLQFILNNFKELYPESSVADMDLDPLQCVEAMIDYKSGKGKLNITQHNLIGLASWMSLKRKGFLLLDVYRRDVLPLIEYVHDIQITINVADDDENVLEGFTDFTASFKDEPGVVYIVDNKTSSRPYKEDSVRTSEQLSTYDIQLKLGKGAYVVMEKDIRKKEPRVRINIIRDSISDDLVEATLDRFDEAVYIINKGEFPENKESGCRPFGQLCDYYGLCHKGSMDFLVKKEG
jgi:hypothetical protein